MTHTPPRAAYLIFTSADPANSAVVLAAASRVVARLQRSGEDLVLAPPSMKGLNDIYLWLLAAATMATPVITLLDLSLKLAQLLNEIRKLRGVEPAAAAPLTITLIVRVAGHAATLHSDTAPDDAALLAQLLATSLPERIQPAELTVEVQVPPAQPKGAPYGHDDAIS